MMKTNKRKMLNEPIRSPSPDVANRSIITLTKSPVNDVKDFLKVRQSSNSPKSITNSFHQISKYPNNEQEQIRRLKRTIHELQSRNIQLNQFKANNDHLLIKVESLNVEIANLKQQIIRRERSSISSSSIGTPRLSPNRVVMPSPKAVNMPVFGTMIQAQRPTSISGQSNPENIPHTILAPISQNNDHNILREFNERIMKMSEQNKRLGKKLKQIKDQKDMLEMENMKLKDQNEDKNRSLGSLKNLGPNFDNIKQYFIEQSDRIVKTQQRMAEGKLNQLNIRICRVEDTVFRASQKTGDARTLNRKNSPFEIKADISTITRTGQPSIYDPETSQFPSYGIDMVESKYASPRQIGAFTLQTSPIRTLEQDRSKSKNQNERLLKRIIELENELRKSIFALHQAEKRLKMGPSLVSQPQSSLTKFYQEKAETLQSQIQTKNSEIKFKELTIQQLQKRLEDSKKFLERELPNYDKVIRQQKEKSLLYQSENDKNQQKVNKFEQIIHNNQKQMEYLRSQFEQIRYNYETQKYNFEKYLDMVLDIKSSITGHAIDQELNEVQRKWEGFDELQNQIMNIKQAYDAIIQNQRKSILERDQLILQLQRDNSLLNQTIKFMNIEREKLQKIIFQYTQPVISQINEQELKRKIAYHQSAIKSRHPCQIRDYVNRTVSKISELERQIDFAVKTYENGKSIQRQEKSYHRVSTGFQKKKLQDSYRSSPKNPDPMAIGLAAQSSPSSIYGSKLGNSHQKSRKQNENMNMYEQNIEDSSLLEYQDDRFHHEGQQ